MLDLNAVHALCFDLDGTLRAVEPQLVNRLSRFIDRLPLLSGRDPELIARRAVMDARGPVRSVHGMAERIGLVDELAQLHSYMERLQRLQEGEVAPLVPGAADLLADLAARYPLAVISGESSVKTQAYLEHHQIEGFFAAVVTPDEAERLKPYPDALLLAAKEMGVATENCLVIGDEGTDMLMGNVVDAQTAGVLDGFGTRDELRAERATVLLDSLAELGAVLFPERAITE